MVKLRSDAPVASIPTTSSFAALFVVTDVDVGVCAISVCSSQFNQGCSQINPTRRRPVHDLRGSKFAGLGGMPTISVAVDGSSTTAHVDKVHLRSHEPREKVTR